MSMRTSATEYLVVSEVSLRFGGLAALEDISFHISEGETLGVVGPNGAGKTSLLNCIMGVYRYHSGHVRLGANFLGGLPPHRIAGLGVGRTFQGADYFADFTALEFVLLSRLAFQERGLVANALGFNKVRRCERTEKQLARSMLDRFDLGLVAERSLSELSYGIRKVLDIIRVLLAEPSLLLLDEPTSGTSAEDRDLLVEILKDLRAGGFTTIVVDHDVRFVTSVSKLLLVMDAGRVLAFGEPNEILARTEVIQAYIGQDDVSSAE